MSKSFVAEYPGATSFEAYQDALDGLKDVPFNWITYDVTVERFFESVMYQSSKDDHELRDTFAENDWTWVATLKARD